MKAIAIALLTASTVYGASELYNTVVPEVSKASADRQAALIVDAAYMTFSLGDISWEDALNDAVTNSRHDGNIRASGTTIIWDNSVDCWRFDIPTADSQPLPEVC